VRLAKNIEWSTFKEFAVTAIDEPTPIPQHLFCFNYVPNPNGPGVVMCGYQHIDEGEFATRPHKTHTCQKCGQSFTPARVPTVGVRFLPGTKNEPTQIVCANERSKALRAPEWEPAKGGKAVLLVVYGGHYSELVGKAFRILECSYDRADTKWHVEELDGGGQFLVGPCVWCSLAEAQVWFPFNNYGQT
jgi:hypothetical protein